MNITPENGHSVMLLCKRKCPDKHVHLRCPIRTLVFCSQFHPIPYRWAEKTLNLSRECTDWYKQLWNHFAVHVCIATEWRQFHNISTKNYSTVKAKNCNTLRLVKRKRVFAGCWCYIYQKYSNTLTYYHLCPKIETCLLICLMMRSMRSDLCLQCLVRPRGYFIYFFLFFFFHAQLN